MARLSDKEHSKERAAQGGGLGQRLRKALEHRRATALIPLAPTDRSSTMMSPPRIAIFSHLCCRPCLSSGEVARAQGISRANAKWHIERLVKSGFLTKHRFGGQWVYAPKNMLSDDEIPVFSVLGNSVTKDTFLKIRKNPGISHGELSRCMDLQRQDLSWHIRKLKSVGLLESLRDGRFQRYETTNIFDNLAKAHSNRTGAFRGTLMKALRDDNTNPSMVRALSHSILIRVRGVPKARTFEIGTDPYGHILGILSK